MQKFQPASYPASALDPETYIKQGATREQAEYLAKDAAIDRIFINDIYQVAVRDADVGGDFPPMWWLSIKRRDKRVIRDWRVLQDIKNTLVGEEHEGVELFPAESRLTDTANQYHLFVLQEKGLRFPFGYTMRAVFGPGEAPASLQRVAPNAKQRALPKPTKRQPIVRHTACAYCGLDIEGFHPFPNGDWRDRGNNTRCNSGDRAGEWHLPVAED